MRLQEELVWEEACVLYRVTKIEEKAASRVDAVLRGDLHKVAEMNRREEEPRAQKHLESQIYRTRRRPTAEACKVSQLRSGLG